MSFLRLSLHRLSSTLNTGVSKSLCSFRIFGIRLKHADGKGVKFQSGMQQAFVKDVEKKQAIYRRFSTESGRKWRDWLANTFIFSAYAYVVLPFFYPDEWIYHYESLETNTSRAQPVNRRQLSGKRPKDLECYLNVNAETQLLTETVMVDLKFEDQHKKKLTVFVADTLEPVTSGVKTGKLSRAAVGLPKYLCFWSKKEDVDLGKVRQCLSFVMRLTNIYDYSKSLNEEDLRQHLSDEEISDLKETFVLSPSAKKFAIAMSLMALQDSTWLKAKLHGWPLSFIVCRLGIVGIGETFNILNRPLPIRLAFYSTLSCMAFLATGTVFSIVEAGWKKIVGEEIVKLGPEYVQGAIEYYEKQVKRGMLLRKGAGDRDFIVDNAGELVRYPFDAFPSENTSAKASLHFFEESSLSADGN